MQGRFTGVDPDNAGAYPEEPQSWNGYSYGRNNPLVFVDPDGLDVEVAWNGGGRKTYRDSEFERFKKDLQKQGFIVKNGNIYAPVMDDDGNVVGQSRIGTYVSDCLYCQQFVREMSRRAEPMQKVLEVGFQIDLAIISGGTSLGVVGGSTLGLRGGMAVAAGFSAKAAARAAVESLAASPAAKAAAKKAIARATAKDTIEVIEEAGTIYVRAKRVGHDGHQVIESVIKSDGSKTVVQKAYDALGRLVHYDPKL